MYRKITLDQEQEIVNLYKYKSQKEIGILFNLQQSSIFKILKRNNAPKYKKSRVNMSKLSLDVDFFKNINTKEKAYWLGYIAADGNINKANNKVSLCSKDKEIIEKFKISIKSQHKISEIYTLDKRTNNTYKQYTIQISNEIFTKNLINIGITNLKTDIFDFPNINEKYYSYFISGLFDGDGSISIVKSNGTLRVDLISTMEILIFIQNYILINKNIEKLKIQRVSKNKANVWRMFLYKDSVNFLNFIYQDKNFNYLQRKYLIYQNNIK